MKNSVDQSKMLDQARDLWVQQEPQRLKLLLSKLAVSVNTHRSLEFNAMLQACDYTGISSLDFNSLRTDTDACWEDLRFDYLFTEVLSKQSFWPVNGVAPSDMALTKFMNSEWHCSDVNNRLYHLAALPFRTDVESCIFYMKRKIAAFCDFNWESRLEFGEWGPGSTKSIKGNYTYANKLGEYPFRISKEAWKLHANIVSSYPGYLSGVSGIESSGDFCPLMDSYIFDDVDRLTTVPKTSKTDRAITILPTALVSTTAAYGKVMRARLFSFFNVDLRDQSRNQRLAENSDLCTIDLSAASDSISLMLIPTLFPTIMEERLMALRTPKFLNPWNKKVQVYHKYAGMGNGITFPLETLIFHTAALAVCEHLGIKTTDVSTYGDDIIVPVAAYDLLIRLLRDLGFSANLKKSNTTGSRMRESCGAHYIDSKDVKPFYIKSAAVDFETCVRNHNRILRYFVRQGLLNFVSLLGILRHGCPMYAFAAWDYKPVERWSDLFKFTLTEEDVAFLVYTLPEIRQPVYKHRYSPQFVRTSMRRALWLQLFELHKSSKSQYMQQSLVRGDRVFLVRALRNDALDDAVVKPRNYRFNYKKNCVYLEGQLRK